MKVLVTQSCLTLCNPWTVTQQTPLSMEFSRQEYWSGLAISYSRACSCPRDWTQVSCIEGRFLTSELAERNRTNRVCMCLYLWEQAHMVMEAKKSHDLPSASWRTSKANYNSVWVQRVDGWPGIQWPKNQQLHYPRGGKNTQLKSKRDRLHPSSAFLFHSGPWRVRWCPPNVSEGGSSLFSLRIQVLISSRDTVTDTPRNNVLPAILASLSPVKLTH